MSMWEALTANLINIRCAGYFLQRLLEEISLSPSEKTVDVLASKATSALKTSKIQNYLKLARFWKPAGTIAFHIPFIFGALLSGIAEPRSFDYQGILLVKGWLLASSSFQRAAACAWNDAADHKFDKQVTRTRNRPIPRGSVSPTAARIWAAILASFWTWSVYVAESQAATWTLIPNLAFNLAYPYMKRFTD